jgi:hypothetical protein
MVNGLSAAKKSVVLQMLKDPTAAFSIAEIACASGACTKTVRKFRAELDAEINGEFYAQRLKDISPSDLMKICKDESYDPSPATTKVQGDRELPTISDHVLKRHRVTGFESNKKRMVQMYQTKDFQGFWICNKDESYDKKAVDEFLERMEDKKNLGCFSPIFEYTQDAPIAPSKSGADGRPSKKQKTGGSSKAEKRFGDNGRQHVRWNELQGVLEKRLDDAGKEVSRLKKELRAAQVKVDAFSKLQNRKKTATRGTKNLANANAEKARKALKRRDLLMKKWKDAVKANRAAEASDAELFALSQKVRNMLCENYARIIKHSPYAKSVEGTINDLRLLSIILTKPKTGSQTMHGDSHQPGLSLLMSARKRQYLIVLLNSFKAMRLLKRLLLKRQEALQYVRRKIAAASPEGWVDSNWDDQAEIRVWSYLCNLQFEHECIGTIKAVRVPIDEGEKLLVDNCTLHGGTPGEDSADAPLAFRFHAYGYVRDILQRVNQDRYEKDEDVTIDPLDVAAGYYPLCRWAQTRSEQPVFQA